MGQQRLQPLLISFLPAGSMKTGSSRLRCYYLSEALNTLGYHTEIGYRPEADILFVQKKITSDVLSFAQAVKKNGGLVIYDIDDYGTALKGHQIDANIQQPFLSICDVLCVDTETRLATYQQEPGFADIPEKWVIPAPVDYQQTDKQPANLKSQHSGLVGAWFGNAPNIYPAIPYLSFAYQHHNVQQINLITNAAFQPQIQKLFPDYHFIPWDLEHFSQMLHLSDFCLIIQSNDTEGQQKSNTRLLTALSNQVVPFVSPTSSHRKLLTAAGLDQLIIHSPEALAPCLQPKVIHRLQNQIQSPQCQTILQQYSAENIAALFSSHLQLLLKNKKAATQMNIATESDSIKIIGLMLTKDQNSFLKIWLKQFSHHFDKLFVLDGSTTDKAHCRTLLSEYQAEYYHDDDMNIAEKTDESLRGILFQKVKQFIQQSQEPKTTYWIFLAHPDEFYLESISDVVRLANQKHANLIIYNALHNFPHINDKRNFLVSGDFQDLNYFIHNDQKTFKEYRAFKYHPHQYYGTQHGKVLPHGACPPHAGFFPNYLHYKIPYFDPEMYESMAVKSSAWSNLSSHYPDKHQINTIDDFFLEQPAGKYQGQKLYDKREALPESLTIDLPSSASFNRPSIRKKLTLATHYYNNESDLLHQIDIWKSYPENIRQQMEFIIINDHSTLDFIPDLTGLDVRFFTIDSDIQWNQAGCRNLIIHNLRTDWVIICDVDNVLSSENIAKIMNGLDSLDPKNLHRFNRTLKGNTINPHVNSFLANSIELQQSEGYDEDFCGHYGMEDLYFLQQWQKSGHKIVQLPQITMYATGNATQKLNRDLTHNQTLAQHKMSGRLPATTKKLRFNWHEVDLKQHQKTRHSQVNLSFGLHPPLGADYTHYHQLSDFFKNVKNEHTENYADEILIIGLLESIPRNQTENTLQQWITALKPDGYLIIETRNLSSICQDIATANQTTELSHIDNSLMLALYGSPDYQHQWLYTPCSLACILQQAGMRCIQQQPAEYINDTHAMRIIAVK